MESARFERVSAVRVVPVALVLLLAFLLPTGTADAAVSQRTIIRGFDATSADVWVGSPISDPVRVQTGDVYAVRKVQVQRRAVPEPWSGGPVNPTPEPWVVESTGTTNARGSFTAVLNPPAGDWEYRLRVLATSDAQAANTPVKKVSARVDNGGCDPIEPLC